MKIHIHELGQWTRSECGTSSTRAPDTVRSYDSIAAIPHPFDRDQVEWMVKMGLRSVTCGATVYEVREEP
ncbi:hypothetical protein [Achromobacter sp. AGC39]